MKKRKTHGLFGTNKRKVKRRSVKKIELENYEDEYDEEAYAEDGEYEDEADYIEDSTEYEDMQSDDEDYAEAYEEEEYADEAYDETAEEYDAEDYADEEEYVDEAYDESAEEYDEEMEDDDSDYEYADEDEYDVGYAAFEGEREEHIFSKQGIDWTALAQRLSSAVHEMTALDVIVAGMGVVLLVAAIVAGSMIYQTNRVEDGIAAIVPVGTELSSVGVVGESGLLAMADARLNWVEETESEEVIYSTVSEEENGVQVSVSFESVERDLKIRFTDASTGSLITGTAFEVTLTNSSSGNQLVLTDDDMDGIIYATNIKAGTFKAVVTSTETYHFPTTAQLVTVKDKVEYVVINVQDEVKSEAQVNVAAEDTQQADAAEEEVTLTDTVEWVEPTKTLISGSESYLLVDKTTIEDPSTVSSIGRRLYLFDGMNVTLDSTSATLYVGGSVTLTGNYKTETNTDETEYSYETSWSSSDSSVAEVSDGKVTAKKAGTATITYTVKKTTKTTTETTKETEISQEDYDALQDESEKAKYTLETRDDQTVYIKTTTETSTDTTTETSSATCTITVEDVSVKSATLEISRSADTCTVGQTITVAPTKLVYTKNTGDTETKTSDFPTITWSSSDTSIATVDSDGTVKGVKAGKVTITGSVTVDSATAKATTDITITTGLAISLDKSEAYIGVNKTTTLTATVSNYQSDSGVTWTTSDKTIATVDEKGVVTGLRAGSVTITATTNEKDSNSKQLTATCKVTVNSDATSDTTTLLKDKNGNQIYIKKSDGTYREAVYADYFTESEFYIKTEGQYAYTGWQTINGKTYYYDKNGKVVTGEQIIQGVTYNFGSDGAIQTSVNGATFGIDVSRHNGTIDWNAVKSSGVDYVIIRCGYRGSSTGALITDQNFQTNIKGATAAGLKVGVYVFSQAINEVEAVKEASLAVSLVKGYNLTYPIFIDTESSGGRADSLDTATRTAVVNAFCQTVKSAGYQAGIYASKSWFTNKLNMSSLSSYRIWLAQYAAAPTYSGRYDMWQYSSKGTISGINGKVDLNLSYLGY